MICDPNTLQQAANGFQGYGGSLPSMRSYLLCQWANKSSGPGQASNPSPADGATGVAYSPNIHFTWTKPAGTTNSQLFINGAFVTNTGVGTLWIQAGLLAGTTYTWRVDSTSATGTTTGVTWTFTTGNNAAEIAWVAAVIAAGGADPSVNTKSAVNIFASALDSAGLTSKLYLVHMFAPDSLIASLTPLIGPAPTNHGFVVGNLSVNGLTGTGAAWLDSNFICDNLMTWPSGGMSTYSMIPPGAPNFVVDAGISENNAPFRTLYTWSWDAGAAFFTTVSTANEIAVATAPTKGFYSGNRVNANDAKLYRASSVIAFNTLGSNLGAAAGSQWPTHTSYIFGYNACNIGVDTITSIMNWPLSFHAIHDGLTAVEAQALYNAVQALRIALGGGFN